VTIKTKFRNRLDVCSDIRLAVSKTEPNIKPSPRQKRLHSTVGLQVQHLKHVDYTAAKYCCIGAIQLGVDLCAKSKFHTHGDYSQFLIFTASLC